MKTKSFDGKAPPGVSLRRAVRALFCLLIITACLAGAVSATADPYFPAGEGDGTLEKPFQISSLDDLKNLSTLVNTATGTYNTSYYKLMANDIEIPSGTDWTPIGNSSTFKGIFDGNGKTITFSAGERSYSGYAYGVFGLNRGTIKNLNVAGTLNVTRDDVIQVGGIAGQNYGTISNCSVTGAVTATLDSDVAFDYAYAGGIAGYNDDGGTISNCYATGAVKAESTMGNAYAGGIAGYNDNGGTISNCYATGAVKAESTMNNARAGGITGYNYGGTATISNCYALNEKITASGSTSEKTYIGRVAGQISGTLDDGNSGWAGMTLNGVLAVEGGINGTDVAGSAVWNNKTTWESSGFVFDSTWKMGTSADFLLPVLKELPAPAGADASHLKPVMVTVTFNANGGTDVEKQEVLYNGKATEPSPAPTRTGYTLAGWNKTTADGEQFNFETQITGPITLVANWTANTYTVKFNNNSGTGEMADQSFTYDEAAKALTANGFTKTGYTFAGWAKTAGGDKVYNDGQSVSNLASEDGAEVTLYAKWTANEYTVKFDGNDATSGSITDLTLTYGQLVEIPVGGNHITKDGHLFVNWNTKADGTGTTYNGEQITDFKDLIQTLASSERTFILYAQWAAETAYIVVFDGSSLPSISVTSGNTITKPEDPTKTGYDFDGWYKESTFENKWNFETDTVTDHVTTLHAKWTPIEYAVKFDANGGEGEMSNQDFTYDVETALTTNAYTRTGYTFAGWAESADGEVVYGNGALVKNLNSTQGGITTLYANWTPVTPTPEPTPTPTPPAPSPGGGGGGYAPVTTTYTVTFDANGGEGSMSPQTFVSGKEKELSLNTFTREGFVFRGWAETADGDAVYVDGETVLVKKSQTLYAVWTELNPTVIPTAEPSGEPTGEPVPTEPGKSPAPVLGMVLGGLAAAAVLRRK